MKSTWNEIVKGTREFVHAAGFRKVVLGLSGGIDSAVVACCACEALGAENVLGCMMPSRYSSPGSITDAHTLADLWGFETVKIPIDSLMAGFCVSLEPALGNRERRPVTRENIQARIRSVLMMAICNEQDRLLLNTCNKSEDLVGYCTLYGDSCGAIAPIGDLYKTEVYRLARWINTEVSLPSIPVEIIDKPPSAELSPDQLDTDDLPPYRELDEILRMHLDDGAPVSSILMAGHRASTVERVFGLIKASEFKRQQSAPVVKLQSNK